jgi:hypothetical protein
MKSKKVSPLGQSVSDHIAEEQAKSPTFTAAFDDEYERLEFARLVKEEAVDYGAMAPAAAIEHLGGPLDAPRRERLDRARDARCWCGSGKKYKKCHLDEDEGWHRED